MNQRRIAAGLVLASLLSLTAAVGGQDLRPRVPFRGTHAFRHILGWFKLQPLHSFEELAWHDSQDTLLIVFGDPKPLDEVQRVTGGLLQFSRAGGAILIATDRTELRHLRELGVEARGRPVTVPEALAYRGRRDFPFITSGLKTNHPIFHGLKTGIATNRPGMLLRDRNSDLLLLATFVPEPWIDPHFPPDDEFNPAAILPDAAPYILGSSGSSSSSERILLVGGHGVFINGMMGQRDNDNFVFAWNCIRWLTEGGKRKHVLFLEEGVIQTDFQPPLAQMPPIPLPTEQAINKLLRGLEEENFHNRLLLQPPLGWQTITQGLILALSVLLLALGLRRISQARWLPERGLPLAQRSLEKTASPSAPPLGTRGRGSRTSGKVRLGAVAQRQQAMLEMNNFGEAAQALAYHWLAGHLGERAHKPAVPRIAASSGKTRCQRAIEEVWGWAHTRRLPTCSRRQLHRLLALLHHLERDFIQGRWRWAESQR